MGIMENKNIKVDVILAAYNGESYIREQIESILNQSHSNLELIISLDPSKDRTEEIILDIIETDSRVKLYKNKRGKGVINNFNNGLSLSKSDYIMFSDQDDYWLKNKVEEMLDLLMKHDVNKPLLAFSDLEIVDAKLNKINSSFYELNSLDPHNNMDKRFLSWKSTCYGCTIIMNRKLFDIAGYVPSDVSMHDHWYAYNAARYGIIFYHPKATIKYRQHDNNLVGSHDVSLKGRIRRVNKTLNHIKKSVNCTAELLKYSNDDFKNTFTSRLNFFRLNIYPFMKERLIYSILFSIFWVLYG